MIRMRVLAAVLGFVIVACESSGGSDATGGGSSGAVAGSPCIDYTSCGAGLFCFVSGDAVEGRCETMPAGCTDCACIHDAFDAKCSSAGSCSSRLDRAVYACPETTRKKADEGCSVARGCEKGLFCRVSTITREGTCATLPAVCSAQATCNCLGAEGCQSGQSVRECTIVGDDASIVCE